MSEEISSERAALIARVNQELAEQFAPMNQERIAKGCYPIGITFSEESTIERTPESDAIGKEMGFNFETNEFDDRSIRE